MDIRRWELVTKIVDLILNESSEDKRREILESASKDDPTIQNDVTEFLKSIDQSSTLWDDLVQVRNVLTDDLIKDTRSKKAGVGSIGRKLSDLTNKQIGPYIIKAHLGSGGMGEVYLAGREDGEFHENVALKLIRSEIDSDDQLRLFLRERKILSSLNHSNIALLLDGGVADDGRPYFVMEYIDGEPVTDYCKKNHCSLEKRLHLFTQVCKAVQHAHSNLIVHRDIKPDNLLVNSDGTIKVLDFGIAKLLLEHQLRDQTLFESGAAHRLMSLNYAAPEQLNLDPINTSTDIYALGLLLYELLTEQKPFQLKGKTRNEAEYIIRNIDPVKPSDLSSSLKEKLKGDLDAIILKALRKEPKERYHTVMDLLEDIERYLNEQPISARPPSTIYHLQKLVKRNRTASVLTAIFLVTLSVFIVLLIQQHSITLQERDRAITEAQKAEHLSGFLVQLFEANDPEVARGQIPTARELLDQGSHQLQTSFQENPELRSGMLMLLGNLYREIGEFEKSRPLLEDAFALAEESGDVNEHAEALRALGSLDLFIGRHEDALETLKKAEQLLEDSGKVPGILHASVNEQLVLSLFRLGSIHDAVERANNAYQKAKANPETPKAAMFDYLVTLANASSLFPPQLEQAEELLSEALLIEEVVSNSPARLMSTHIRLLNIVGRRGDLITAVHHGREALKIAEQIYPPMHFRRSESLYNLALPLFYLGQFDESIELLTKAKEINDLIDSAGRHYLVSGTHHYLGLALRYAERFEEAKPHYERAKELISNNYGLDNFRYTNVTATTGDIYRQEGRTEEGKNMLYEAMEKRKLLRERGQYSMNVGSLDLIVVFFVDMLIAEGRNEKAITIADQAIQHLYQSQFDAPNWILFLNSKKAKALHKFGRINEAKELFEESVELGISAGENSGFGFTMLYEAYADFATEHDPENAPLIIEEAHQTHLQILGAAHPATQRIADLLNNKSI